MKYPLKGNNSMHLNSATMIQIIQEWLDNTTRIKAVVTGISFSPMEHCFEIKMAQDDRGPDCAEPGDFK